MMNTSATKNAFNKAAKTYDNTAVLAKEVAGQLVDRLQYMALSPNTILEVGSGTGFVAQALREVKFSKAYTIHVDYAVNMLQQSHHKRNTPGKIVDLCADTHKLPLKTHSIDLLISNLCLPFVDDLAIVLDEWQRVLKPGGLCLFTTLGHDTLKELKQAFSAVSPYPHVQDFLDMHDVGDALVQAKFAEPVMDADVVTMAYEGVDDLLLDLKNQGVVNTAQQRSRGLFTPRFLNQVKQHYPKRDYSGVDNHFPVTIEVIYGCAWATDVIPNKRVGNEIHVPFSTIKRS